MATSHAPLVLPLRAREAARRRRWPFIAAVVILALTVVAYAGVSFYAVMVLSSDYPRAAIDRAPNVAAAYENVAFKSTDGLTLRGWYFPVARDRAVVLLHGRDDDRTWGGKYEALATQLIGAGYSVLMFDMRGHGSSDGEKRYTMGYYERYDVAGAIDYVVSRGVPERGVALVAISLGAATAIETLPLRPDVGPVIVESAYSDFQTLITEYLPRHTSIPAIFAPGIGVMARVALNVDVSQMRPVDVVRAHPERAFLFIQCQEDDFVLPHHATELRAASANAASDLWLVPECGHVDASQHAPNEYRTHVLGFLAQQYATAP